MLNSLAAVTWEDFLKLKFSALSERSATKVTRTLGKIDKVQFSGFFVIIVHVKARKRACDNFQIHAVVQEGVWRGEWVLNWIQQHLDFYQYLASLYTINCFIKVIFKTNIYY